MGGPLDVPQHGTDETHNAKQSSLDPHLQEEVVGVDKGGLAVVEVHILDERLGCSGTETRSGDGGFLDNVQRRLVQGHAAGCGRIVGVGDGQNAVPDGGGNARYTQHTHHREGRDELRPPQEHQHHHGTRDAHPAGPGIGHAQGHHAHHEHTAGRQPGNGPFGAQEQRQRQGQQQNQHLGKGIGVVKKGLHAARHPGIDLQIHIGGIDLHALNALPDTVQRGHQYTHRTAGGQALQFLTGANGADGDQHAEGRGNVVNQKAQGQRRRIGKRHRQEHGAEEHQRIKAHGPQVQPEVLSPMHGTGVEQHQQQRKAHQAVCVVPPLEWDDPQQHDEPGLGDRGLIPQAEGQACKKAVLKCPGQGTIQQMQKAGREIHKRCQDAAEQAIRPSPGHGALPAQNAKDCAAIDLPVAPGAADHQAAVDGARLISRQQPKPKLVNKALFQKCHKMVFLRSGFSVGTAGSA